MCVLKNKPHVHLRYKDPETKEKYCLSIIIKLEDRVLVSGPTLDENQNVLVLLSPERAGAPSEKIELCIEYPKPPPAEPTEFEVQVWGQTENPGDNLLGKAKIKYEPSEEPDTL